MIGEKIKELRKNAHLTQKELAKLSGIAEITIRKYENNQRNPKKEQIERIARALNVDPFDILAYKDFDSNIDIDALRKELNIIEKIQSHYGKDSVELLENYILLNDVGKNKAFDYISDLSEQEKYKQ